MDISQESIIMDGGDILSSGSSESLIPASIESTLNTSNESDSIASSCFNKEIDSTERLVRKLSNFESTINELMSLGKPTVILKEKLSQMDDLILDIPSHCEELASEWRAKVASWWRLYASFTSWDETRMRCHHLYDHLLPASKLSSQLYQQNAPYVAALTSNHLSSLTNPPRSCSAPPLKPIGHTPERRYFPALNGPPPVTWETSKSPLRDYLYGNKPLPQSLYQIDNRPPTSLTSTYSNSNSNNFNSPRFGSSPSLPNFPDATFYNVFVGPATKNSIRAQLKAAFEELTDIGHEGSVIGSAAYIDGMQKLLAAVAKSIKAIIPYVSDDQLLMEVSLMAIQKMPTEKKEEFNNRYDRHSLFNLMRFLRKEIVMYYEKFNNSHHIFDTSSVVTSFLDQDESTTDSDAQQQSYCVYCRHDGHRVHECPIKRGMLCFKCYEFGHTLKCCPNPTLINIK